MREMAAESRLVKLEWMREQVRDGSLVIRQLDTVMQSRTKRSLVHSSEVWHDPRTAARLATLGANAYFPKPYSPAAVRHKLEQLINAC